MTKPLKQVERRWRHDGTAHHLYDDAEGARWIVHIRADTSNGRTVATATSWGWAGGSGDEALEIADHIVLLHNAFRLRKETRV